MRFSAKVGAVAAATTAVVAMSSGVANAYDCFNASRSATGDATAAANSGNWWSVSEFLGVVGFTPDQIATALPVINADPRVPANFTIYFNPNHPMELATNMPTSNATNGKGIDHSNDYGDPIVDVVISDAAAANGLSL